MISFKNVKLLVIAVILLCCMQVASAGIDEDVVSEIASDYYDVYGYPHLTANLACDEAFERGEEAVLYINLMNDGQITGYEADYEEIEDDIAEYGDTLTRSFMSSELASDRAITKAESIRATLSPVDPDAPVDVRLDTLLLGSVSSGKSLGSPAAFPIKIYDDAEAGTYELKLDVSYRYQRDSAVAPPYGDTYYWYEEMDQTMYVTIVIEEEPYFRVANTGSDLQAGDRETINVTYVNNGDDTAYDCVARISVVDPFTSTDDESYLGDMGPGESGTATFEIKVADDATVKTYSINSEIKYKDGHDESHYSEGLKATVDVAPATPFGEKIKDNASVALGLIFMVGVVVVPAHVLLNKKKVKDK
ncbi:MAG: hypothetical protein JW705_02905 [Methanosarcinaceae archaeon]|nr:hypothetical protein [Methanosarcinaceae archaeon]